MLSAEECYAVFQKSIDDYHLRDDVDTPMKNPFPQGSFESLLYVKNWIDTVQWHLEDIIRNPEINPVDALAIKRRIDKSNQDRTDTVEKMDDFFLEAFREVRVTPDARINSETPAWLLDRMSILMLKIYHMKEQTERKDVSAQHLERCRQRVVVLEEQKEDMHRAFTELIEDIGSGRRRFKVYRQMKMYNDSSLNPVLYKSASASK
jgi:KaiC/GvpD/RAD55 family RecA-like ATPase